jgi:uncharacterized protein (TIGR02328 family)
MRLWHQDLIQKLPRQQLLGQHRECCALRGNGWGKPHSTINYIFNYSLEHLYAYHMLIIKEMEHRGYNVDASWKNIHYRGKICPPLVVVTPLNINTLVYKEHNESYMLECVTNLLQKGIRLE